MVQGTTSDAGKSTIVAGLCRILARKKIRVAPFKPQNMALNSAVVEGGEIGRAQWLQAVAAGVTPTVHMNPILIKPASDIGAQIIVHGKALNAMDASEYHRYKPQAMSFVKESYTSLLSKFEAIIVEGAGSPAEINLRKGDVANMGFAEEVDCPVIIVADIDKGGVFAHIVGTLALLSESEQNRVIGFVINKFRGDINLLTDGLAWLENKTNKPVFGVLPMIGGLHLDAEDAIEQQQSLADASEQFNQQQRHHIVNVCVLVLPRISNHTDFDALRYHPDVNLTFVGPNDSIPACDLIIIPGSKSVIADMQWMEEKSLDNAIKKHLRYGGKVLGICGGMQILGESIRDPRFIESKESECKGLGLLPITTEMGKNKTLKQRQATLILSKQNISFSAYEIHHGSTKLVEHKSTQLNPTPNEPTQVLASVSILDNGDKDGFISADNQVLGTYLHGIFDSPEACNALLEWAGLQSKAAVSIDDVRENSLNLLADSMEQHIDFNSLEQALETFWLKRNA